MAKVLKVENAPRYERRMQRSIEATEDKRLSIYLKVLEALDEVEADLNKKGAFDLLRVDYAMLLKIERRIDAMRNTWKAEE